MSYRMIGILEKEIDKIAGKGELTNQSLENVYKLSKSLYYLSVVDAMEEGGEYSERYMYDDMGGNGYSGRRRRDSRGRYSRDNSYDSRRGGDSGGRYSNDDNGYSGHGDSDMRSMIEDMMDRTSDSKERETLRKLMNQIG